MIIIATQLYYVWYQNTLIEQSPTFVFVLRRNCALGLGGIAILEFDISYRDITVYRGFYKTCGLTVLLGCFDLFIDLVLLVPDFCIAITILLASKEFLDTVKPQ